MASQEGRTLPRAVSRSDARTARRLVGVLASDLPPHDADDVAQEVLCALAFHRGPLDGAAGRTAAGARAAFLRRAAVRQLAEHERRRARCQIGDGLAADVLPPPVTPSAEDLTLAFAPLGTLRRALASLHETEPDLYALLDSTADGVSLATAAAILGIPVGTACSRLRRARSFVRAFFRREAASGREAGCGA